jgi:two-component system LytT family response regulator
MMAIKLKFLVIENAITVCEGIINRMKPYQKWESIGFTTGIHDSCKIVESFKPQLLFMDWDLAGGSAYEILRFIQNLAGYDPYIIFNTGFQKDNPDIPMEIINNYHIDKYLIKPIWEDLRLHLPDYLLQAESKAMKVSGCKTKYWLKNIEKEMVLVNLDQLSCISQNALNPRIRDFYFIDKETCISTSLSWAECVGILDSNSIDYFASKKRSHLIVKQHITGFEKPFVRVKNVKFKLEVVRENLKPFEDWLKT